MSSFSFTQTATPYASWQDSVDLATPLGLTNIRGFGAVQAYACSDGTFVLLRLQSGYVTDIVHSTSMTISDTGAWIESTLTTAGVSQGGPWLPLYQLTDAMAAGLPSSEGVRLLMAGDDRFTGTAGNETFVGGEGFDLVSYAGATAGVVANLATGVATGQGTDAFRGIEALAGSAFADRLTGDANANLLQGGGGADTLSGGGGADVFRFAAPGEGGDRVLGYVGAEDQVEISAAGFGGGLAAGMDLVATGHYVANKGGLAKGLLAQFVFDTSTKLLWWDDDGRGAHAHVLIADLNGATGWSGGELTVIA